MSYASHDGRFTQCAIIRRLDLQREDERSCYCQPKRAVNLEALVRLKGTLKGVDNFYVAINQQFSLKF